MQTGAYSEEYLATLDSQGYLGGIEQSTQQQELDFGAA